MSPENSNFDRDRLTEELKMQNLAKSMDMLFSSLLPVDPDSCDLSVDEQIEIPRKLYLEIDLKSVKQISPELKQTLLQDIEEEPEAAHDVEIADSIREVITEAIAQQAKANPQSICNLVKDVHINWELTS